MKKLIAFGLCLCLAATLLVSCGEPTPPVETTPVRNQKYNVEDSVLKTCIGQADENGVFVVPDTVTAIGEGAFGGDTTLREVIIGKNVKLIGSAAFQGCTALRKVTVEEGVTDLGSYAFYGCSMLTEISLPSTVKEILPYTFYGCESLEALDLSSVRRIHDSAMWYCLALEKVTLSAELTSIGKWSFSQCRVLSDINLEDCPALTELSDFSFSGCPMLTAVTIPDGVKRIGAFAFHNCKRLGDIQIPDGVESIDYGALNYTPWYQENTEPYLIVGNGVLVKCTAKPAELDLSGKGIRYISAAFWNTVSDEISEEYGYKYANELEAVVIPEGVTVIGSYAFKGCYGLKSISLPSTLERVEYNAFNIFAEGLETTADVTPFTDCPALEYIGELAFYGCGGIDSLELPASTRYVGQYAFASTSAFNRFIEAAASTDDETKHTFITGDGLLLFAYVPDGVTTVSVPEGVKIVGGGAYCGWDNALYLTEDEKDTLSITGRSKYNLTYAVRHLILPSTLETICDNAFFRMSLVETVVFPDSLRKIGNAAFAFCSALSVSDSAKVTEFGDSVFASCNAIQAFTFSADVEKIGAGLFTDCPALRKVTFPEGSSSLGEGLFNGGCQSLQEIIIDPVARPLLYSILGTVGQEVKVHYYVN